MKHPLLPVASAALLCLASACVRSPDLPVVKERLVAYYQDGDYERDLRTALKPARKILETYQAKEGKAALVLDIDETALSTWEYQKGLRFGHYGPAWHQWIEMERATAIVPLREIYELALKKEVDVFFITGRRDRSRAATEGNLRKAGYTRWAKLFTKPDDYKEKTVVPYKSACRKEIAATHRILLNIGDQQSDLAGGFAEHAIKLPNLIYRVH